MHETQPTTSVPRRSQHARDAAGDLRALKRLLADSHVVERLDALAPGVDVVAVDVARGHGVREEQREREPLINLM